MTDAGAILPTMASTDVEKSAALRAVPLFQGISAESLARLVAVTGEQSFRPGQFIVLQGQVGSGLYVILEGTVRIVLGSTELTTLGPGEFFGELAVIDQQPRNASVQAATPGRCLALASWDLLQLLESDPALALNLIRGLVERIREHGEQHRN